MNINLIFSLFFFNDTATTEIYTLSLHDALPIYLEIDTETWENLPPGDHIAVIRGVRKDLAGGRNVDFLLDRKSTRLNSSHSQISYAVFCLKKKKKKYIDSYSAHLNTTKSHAESY